MELYYSSHFITFQTSLLSPQSTFLAPHSPPPPPSSFLIFHFALCTPSSTLPTPPSPNLKPPPLSRECLYGLLHDSPTKWGLVNQQTVGFGQWSDRENVAFTPLKQSVAGTMVRCSDSQCSVLFPRLRHFKHLGLDEKYERREVW